MKNVNSDTGLRERQPVEEQALDGVHRVAVKRAVSKMQFASKAGKWRRHRNRARQDRDGSPKFSWCS